MLGIVWGIVAVTVLMAYGNGFRAALVRGFDAFGKSAVVAWPGQTSEQAGGERAGRPIRFEKADLDAVLAEATLVKQASLETVRWLPISYGDRMSNTAIRGVYPDYGEIRNEVASEGRWLIARGLRRAPPRGVPGRAAAQEAVRRPAGGGRDDRSSTACASRSSASWTVKLQFSNYFTSDDECAFIPYTAAGDLWDARYASVLVFSAP